MATSKQRSGTIYHRTPNNTPHVIPPDEDTTICASTRTNGTNIIPVQVQTHKYPLQLHQMCQTSKVPPAPSLQENVGIDQIFGNILEYCHLEKGLDKQVWNHGLANSLGCLVHIVGTRMPKVTNTIFFVKLATIPRDGKILYVRLVSSLQPNKTEVYTVWVTADDDQLEYDGNTSTEAAIMTTTKILLKNMVSHPEARFMILDIKDVYYGIALEKYKYLRMALTDIPQEIIE